MDSILRWVGSPRIRCPPGYGQPRIRCAPGYGSPIAGCAPRATSPWAAGSAGCRRLMKVDVRERATRTWSEPGDHPGWRVFVGRPSREAEDDGVLLSVGLDADH
ncbi:MAG: hypothetical protein WCF36_00845 [Candidatus Nanopelagicales bacterium]